ncbi:MAG TPA: gliding motility-associated C-terminal domain-containing protein [Saprospiraceae bacterium]|nr:gliding motility-associated C-terminal domain-containing protein [Saprospiraceae bacterium]
MDLIAFGRPVLPGLICCMLMPAYSQNLVPNPSFETFDVCPVGYNPGFGPLQAPPWFVPTTGSSDYFNECSVGVVDVPTNAFCSSLPAHTGVAYAGGLYYYAGIPSYREYLQVQLTEPLVAGQSYDVSLYYAIGDLTCGMDKLGIYISEDAIQEPGNISVLDVTPQLEVDVFLDNNDWVFFSECYIAVGGEEYITIGSYYYDSDITLETGCPLWGGMVISYVLIDDVSVEEGPPPGPLDFTLGDDLVVCDETTLEVLVTNAYYTWQDGSHEQTYTVTETGEYHVTVSKGCTVGYDTIFVEVLESPDPIDLGAPEQILCPGETIEYDFDPDLGDFLWQDNSTSSSYTINAPGVYSVTISTVCGSEEDMVNVIGLEPPEPIDLGPDITLCPFEEISFTFDPGLGDFEWQDGSITSSFTVTEPGLYALTISNYCGEVNDEIEVEYYPEPFVVFSEDTIALCEGESVTLSLDPDIGEYFWQDGEEGPEYTVTQPGVYSVTVVNPCGSDNTSIVIDYDYEPIVDLGPDITICPQQLPYTFNLTGLADVEHFLWDDGTMDPIFTIYDAGEYGVTVSNDCFEVWDLIDVTIEDASPEVMLGADTLLCPGEVLFLDVGNIPGTYQWQDNNNGAVYGVTQSGVYSVTVTNACGVDSDSIEVGFDDFLPTLDLGPDLMLCPGEQATIDAGVTGVDFLWHDGSTLDSIVVDVAGMVILIISNDCAMNSDTVEITINASVPDADLPAQLWICTGDSVTIATSVTGVTYSWSTGNTTSSITTSDPGEYILTVTNSCGMDVDTATVIDLGSEPMVDLGLDQSICSGDTAVFNPGIGGTYLWQDGSSNTFFEATNAGTVTLVLSNSCGVAYDTAEVLLLDAIPQLDLGPDTSICPGNSVLIAPGIPDVTYTWNDGSTGTTFIANTSGYVFLDITNACGLSSDTLEVSLLPDAPSLDLGIDFSICPGDTVVLAPGVSGASYVWQDGSTDNTYEVTTAGQIILTVSNTCGSAIDTVQVSVNTTGPALELGPDISVCEGESVLINPGINGVTYLWQDGSTNPSLLVAASAIIVLEIANSCGVARDTLDVVISGVAPELNLGPDINVCEGETVLVSPGISDVTYLWQDGSTNSSLLVTTSSMIVLEITNACGVARDTMDVVIAGIAPQVDLGPDTLLCDGEILILTVDNTGVIVEWQDGSSGPVHMIEDAGLYTVSLTNLCGVTSDSVTVLTEVSPPPFDLGADQLICAGDVITLEVPLTKPGDNLLWSTGSTASSIDVSVAGEYVLMISNVCGSASDVVTVEVNTTELSDVVDNLFTYCDGDQLILNVQQPIPATYLWNNGATGTTLTVTHTGTYSVTITAECDQLMEDILVEAGDCLNPNIFIPNVFTPNGDDVNDIFRIEMDDRDLLEFQVWIYDRWGDVVYNSLNPDFEWKGDFNGKELQPGVYVYHMLVSRQIGSTTVPERLKGDVTLIR